MGIVSPIGEAVEVFWRHLLEGDLGIAPMKAYWASEFRKRALGGGRGRLFGSQPVPPAALRNTDRFTQFAMAATVQALDQAQLEPPQERTAVIVGNTMGAFPLVAQAQTALLNPAAAPYRPN